MGGEDGEMMFKHGDETGVAEVEMTSMPLYAKVDPFFPSADWNPVVSAMGSSSHYTSLVMENSGMSGFAHYQPGSGSSYVDMSTSLLPGSNQIGHFLGSDKKGESEGRLRRTGEIHEDHQVSEDGVLGASPCRKRRQSESDSAPSSHWNKKAVEESLKDVETEDQNQKKVESERNMIEDSGGKAPVDKGNYIHVRARRGQATNSHSLAERVRREKISERMRLLQELVPGCNKITGKAVMLDEIINYVQSLQQQVEFLSMKLATVNPELNIDVDRIEQEIILHSRDRNTIMLGLSTGMNHLYQYSTIHGTIPNLLATNPQFNPLPQQTVLDTELQSLYQMEFVSNPSNMESLPPNGAIETGDVMHQR